jgi:hypothetical protein
MTMPSRQGKSEEAVMAGDGGRAPDVSEQRADYEASPPVVDRTRAPVWRQKRNLLRCRPFGLRQLGRPSWLVHVELLFEPRDLWVGVYWNVPEGGWRRRVDLYVCLLPTLVWKVMLRGAR